MRGLFDPGQMRIIRYRGFGGRPEETGQSKDGHRASGRPNRAEGKKHDAALICLARRRCDVLYAMLTARISIGDQRWTTARREAVDAAAGPQEHVYAGHFLFWDAVTVAEIATGHRPTDPLPADAVWGAAAVTLHAERLSASTVDILTVPGAAAGLSAAS